MSASRLLASTLLAALLPTFAAAQGPEIVAIKGALFAKKGDGHWEAQKAGVAAPLDKTLVSLFDSEFRSKNGAVDVRLRGDLAEFGPLPVYETAVSFHDSKDADLSLTLERGIVVFTNAKKDGPAHVLLKIRDVELKVSLLEPGTKLGFDLYGRHSPGLGSITEDNPPFFIFALNAVGSAQIAGPNHSVQLKAPPGPALLKWDSVTKVVDIQHLDKLPPWAVPSPERLKIEAEANRAAKTLGEGDTGEAFVKLLFSDNAIDRKVGLTAAAALGSPGPVFVALQKSKHADTRQFAIGVIRNWLGREPGQIAKLHKALGLLGLSKVNIETLTHLLLGFDQTDREQPATYQALIAGLDHSKLLVRELSYWHLQRLVPAGGDIAYDPAGDDAGRRAAVERWRALIPAGELPPTKK
jgi:hypothetical protein